MNPKTTFGQIFAMIFGGLIAAYAGYTLKLILDGLSQNLDVLAGIIISLISSVVAVVFALVIAHFYVVLLRKVLKRYYEASD